MSYEILDQVKKLLGINTGDIDALLEIIINATEKRLKMLLKKEVPEELQYIITEVSVKRYNRIGNEGMKSASVEGASMTFEDDDFAQYQAEIDSYLAEEDKKGIVRFI